MANIPVVYYVDNITTPTQSVNLAVNGIAFANNLDTTPTGIAINSSGIAYNTGSATQTTTWSNLSTRVAQLVAIAPNPTATTLAIIDTLTLENANPSPSATVNIQANNSAGVGTQFGLSFNDSLNSNFTVSTSGTGKLSISAPLLVSSNATFSSTLTAPTIVNTSITGVPSGVNSTTSNLSMSVQGYGNTGQSITLTSIDPYISAGLGNSYSNIVVNTDATYPVALTALSSVFGTTSSFTLGVNTGGIVLNSGSSNPSITGLIGGYSAQVWIYSGIYVTGGVSNLTGGIVNTIGGSFGGSAPANTNQVGEFIPTGASTIYSSNSTYSGAYFQHRTIITGAVTTTRT